MQEEKPSPPADAAPAAEVAHEVFPEALPDDAAEKLRPLGADAQTWRTEAQEALRRLRAKPAEKRFSHTLVLFTTLVLFALTLGNMGWLEIAGLVAILLFHELGHLLAMRLFGYHDTRVFFIPFFGAAAAGRKDDASQVQRAIVALAGPVPGIALSVCYLIAVLTGRVAHPSAEAFAFAGFVLAVNGLNLMPFVPLDGGRFFNAILFSRHPWLETGCKLLAAAVFCAAGYVLGSWLFGIIGVLLLFSLNFAHRAAILSRRLRLANLNRPPGLAELPDAELLQAYLLARDAYPGAREVALTRLLALRTTLLQRAYPNALSEPAPAGAAALLLAVYLAAFGATGFGLGYVFVARSGRYAPEIAEAEGYYRAGDIVAAIITAQQALKTDPDSPAAHAALSLYLYQANSHEEAAEHARRALQLQPRDPRPYFVLGAIACDAGDSAGARAQLEALRAHAGPRNARRFEALLKTRIRALESGAQPPEQATPPNQP